jgi:hypothetical protein
MTTTKLAGVRRQIEEAVAALKEATSHATYREYDPAYRAALKSRNLLFHAVRGLAAAAGKDLPETPVTGTPGGNVKDARPALEALEAALADENDQSLGKHLEAAMAPYARFLGFLRDEVSKLMQSQQ